LSININKKMQLSITNGALIKLGIIGHKIYRLIKPIIINKRYFMIYKL